MTKARDLRDKSVEELEATYNDTCRELFDLRNATQREKKIERPHILRAKRKEIARLLTVMNEKQQPGQPATRGPKR